ncbi:hypothetical protein [Stomatohabitans albus]|uniref:hypothetical protein n=1 Tax=Stomatohabitans albus TaxID=3110766 RepID=UPI00300C1505
MSTSAFRTPRLVTHLADAFDAAGLDLWAADLRACLQSPSSLDQARAIQAECMRLIAKPSVRATARRPDEGNAPVEQEDLVAGLQMVLDRLSVELGEGPSQAQPLYEALRDLADDLQLNNQARWLARLRHVALDTSFTEEVRMERLDNVICSALTDDSLPGDLLTACRVRLESIFDAQAAAAMAAAAMRPPMPRTPVHAETPPPEPARPDGVIHQIVTEEYDEDEE